MTARIAGFVTRAAAGLRGPESISRNITPDKGGVAIHYGGPRQPAAESDADHALCVKTWLAWQNYHMNVHGWVDIAYTGGFCNHGFAFAGRGAGIRTAAQGTNAGNQNYYGVVWIGGEYQTPTQAAYDAAEWWIDQLRKNGKAGKSVKPHRFFHLTGCPGDSLLAFATTHDGKDISIAPPKPAPAPTSPHTYFGNCVKLQRAVRVTPDNHWGPNTEKACEAVRLAGKKQFPYGVKFVQGVVGTKQDGAWGAKSRASLQATIVEAQRALIEMSHVKFPLTGVWDEPTERAYQKVRKICKRF